MSAPAGRHASPGLATATLALSIALLPCGAAAQTNERIYEELDFRFVTPGARAVGMGHTFIGLADDATAANSNPAGLSNLLEPEFSVEFNLTKIRHHRFVPAESGEPQTQAFGELVLIPSFFSYALPLKRSTLLFFRNTAQDYKERFLIPPRFIQSVGTFEDGAFGSIAIEAENYGVGMSYLLNRYLSVGGSLVLSTLDVATEGRSGHTNNPRNGTNTIDSASGWSGIAGVLVKPHRRVSAGFAYYGGRTFTVTTTLFGEFLFTGFPDIRLTGEQHDVDYVIPDRYAAGASWRLRDNITVVADVSRVRYSRQVTDRFLIVDFIDPAAGLTKNNFFIDDVTEIHAGGEYRIYRQGKTIAFRGGVFTDPDHQMHYRSGGNNTRHIADRLLRFRFNSLAQQTDVGVTAGGGIAIANKFQIDAATSLSRDSRQLVVSMVFKP